MKLLMFVFSIVLAMLAALIVGLFVFTRIQSWWIGYQIPALGAFMDVGGYKLHYVDVPPSTDADLPPLVFIHGASGNLRDQMLAFKKPLEGRARMIFVDRPGHGYSERGGPENNTPVGQADAISTLLTKLNIPSATIIGHSFGSSIVAAFAVNHPEQVKGLVFLAPATHPWPGADVSWYYRLTAMPVAGYLFSELLALPAGLQRMKCATTGVFSPNTPPDNYIRDSGAELVLRPWVFRNNARDVAGLYENVSKFSPRYTEITAPTVIITGDSDDIVLANIHSKGLERDIEGARLIELENVGHKPDYIATSLAIKAIEDVSRP